MHVKNLIDDDNDDDDDDDDDDDNVFSEMDIPGNIVF